MTTKQEINRIKRMELCKHCVHWGKKGCLVMVSGKGCVTKNKWVHNGATDVLSVYKTTTAKLLSHLEPVLKKKE